MRLPSFVCALAASVAVCSASHALKCVSATDEEFANVFERAEAVFSGLLVKVEHCASPADPSVKAYRFTYEVSRVWKGPIQSTIAVRMGADFCSNTAGPIYEGPCEQWVESEMHRQAPRSAYHHILVLAYASPQGLSQRYCDSCDQINGAYSLNRAFLTSKPSRTPR